MTESNTAQRLRVITISLISIAHLHPPHPLQLRLPLILPAKTSMPSFVIKLTNTARPLNILIAHSATTVPPTTISFNTA